MFFLRFSAFEFQGYQLFLVGHVGFNHSADEKEIHFSNQSVEVRAKGVFWLDQRLELNVGVGVCGNVGLFEEIGVFEDPGHLEDLFKALYDFIRNFLQQSGGKQIAVPEQLVFYQRVVV